MMRIVYKNNLFLQTRSGLVASGWYCNWEELERWRGEKEQCCVNEKEMTDESICN